MIASSLKSVLKSTESRLLLAIGALIVILVFFMVMCLRPAHVLVSASDGKPAWLVTCSTPGDCITEASKACVAGYVAVSDPTTNAENGGGALMIRCSESR